MNAIEGRYLIVGAALIEVLAAVVIVYHVGLAVIAILRGWGVDAARLEVAEGVLAGLGFSVAATLLKTIALEDWAAIRTFAFVLVLRTLLKKVFQRERQMALKRNSNPSRRTILADPLR